MEFLPEVEVTDEGVTVHAQPQEDTSPVELLPVQGLLGVGEDPGPRQRTQMKVVWDFFSKDAQGVGDALYRIKQTEMKMAPPKLGESRLSKLYSYVKTKGQLSDLEAQLESL